MSILKSDDPLPSYGKFIGKRNLILGGMVLLLMSGFFFDSLVKGVFAEEKLEESASFDIKAIDPLSRVGGGISAEKCANPNSLCGELDEAEKLGMGDEKMAGLVTGYPIVDMVPYISQRDQRVGHFLVAIAKKESDWGKHTPKKDGKECYNYWGYRGPENTTDSGYSCFDSPGHAVEVVGNRIEKLVNQNIDTPAKMVVWKCGSNCEAAGGQAAADKWISDVATYVAKLNS